MSERRLDPRIEEVLRDDLTWAEPPAEVEDRVLAGITSTAVAMPEEDTRPGKAIPLLIVGAAVAALLFAFAGGLLDRATPAPIHTVLAGSSLAEGVDGTVMARPTGNGWWIRLEIAGLEPAPAGAFYEGWVWSDGTAVSIGTFHMRAGDGAVTLWSGVDLAVYSRLSVTVQSEGGGNEPSDRVMATADLGGA